MLPGMNPRDVQKAMKRLGIQQQEIEATEVIIKCRDKELVIRNPSVAKVNMMGQQSIQVVGDIEERDLSQFSEEDINTVMEQANVDKNTAKKALEKEGDIAAAIISLKK